MLLRMGGTAARDGKKTYKHKNNACVIFFTNFWSNMCQLLRGFVAKVSYFAILRFLGEYLWLGKFLLLL